MPRTTGWTTVGASQPRPPRGATLSRTGGAARRRVPLFDRRPRLRAWPRPIARRRRRDRPSLLSHRTARRDRPLLRRRLLRRERRPRRPPGVLVQRRAPFPAATAPPPLARPPKSHTSTQADSVLPNSHECHCVIIDLVMCVCPDDACNYRDLTGSSIGT